MNAEVTFDEAFESDGVVVVALMFRLHLLGLKAAAAAAAALGQWQVVELNFHGNLEANVGGLTQMKVPKAKPVVHLKLHEDEEDTSIDHDFVADNKLSWLVS